MTKSSQPTSSDLDAVAQKSKNIWETIKTIASVVVTMFILTGGALAWSMSYMSNRDDQIKAEFEKMGQVDDDIIEKQSEDRTAIKVMDVRQQAIQTTLEKMDEKMDRLIDERP